MAQNKEIFLQGQSSQSPTNVTASTAVAVLGQAFNYHINAPNTEGLPGQSQKNAAASSSPAVLGQRSSSQINAPADNWEIVPWQSSSNQISAPASNSEAALSLHGSSSLQPMEENTEPITDTNLDTHDDDTDSNSDDSVSSEEPEFVREWRRKHAYYLEKLRVAKGGQPEERPQGTRKRQVDEEMSEMSPQTSLEHHHNNIKIYLKKAMGEANMQGYVYGIVLENDTVLSGSSDTLQAWWEETIRFELVGPLNANKYYAENQVIIDPHDSDEPPKRTYELIMQLSDGTMGALLSALMSKCDPPQRRFPFENRVAPPWWPTENESWWDETGLEREPDQPQYKKPHDLKKKWKAVIVLSVIKHMAPNFGGMLKIVKSSKHLQDRLSVKEMNAWNFAIKEEMKIYSREHPDIPLPDLLKAFQIHNPPPPGQSNSSTGHDAIDHLQQQEVTPQQMQQPQQVFPAQQQQQMNQPGGYEMLSGPRMQQQQQEFPMPNQPGGSGMLSGPQMEMSPWSQQRRSLLFTCKNQGCLHNDFQYGFSTAALRDDHQIYCGYNSMNQIAVPGELPMCAPIVPPFDSTSQIIVPPQQMVPEPPQHPMVPSQQIVCEHPPSHPMDPSQQMVHEPPLYPMGTPQPMVVEPSLHPMGVQPQLQRIYGSYTELMPPQHDWASFNSGILNYSSMVSGGPDINQLQSAFNFGGFTNVPGRSRGGGNFIGPYTQFLTDPNSNAMLLPHERELEGMFPTMNQYPMENFQYGAGEGSSNGVFQETGTQQFQPIEMQFFPTHLPTETDYGGIQTNNVPEEIQFGQIRPIDGSFVPPSQQPMEIQGNAIPQEYMQQTGTDVMQNPPSSAEHNQFHTDNSEP